MRLIVRTLIVLSVLALPVSARAQLVTSGSGNATAAKQDTGNGYLSTLAGKDFATSAKQDTGNASLASIKTNTDALDIALSALRDALVGAGPKTLTDVVTALGSLTVAISGSVTVTGPLTDTQLRATPVPVSGTFYQATQPVSGTFFQVTQPVSGTFFQATQPVSLATAPTTPVTGTFFQATQPVSAASLPLPTSAATDAKQDTGNTSLASIDSKITAVNTGAVVISSGTITTVGAVTAITNALPAGANAIGKLAANSGVDIGDVDVTSVAGNVTVVQPTGSNLHVAVDSAPTTAVTGTFYQATQPVSVADGSDVTLGAKADAKSTATDGTAVTIMSVLKEISAMEQAPASQAVTNAGTFATQSAITAASGAVGSGAIASGAVASGAYAAGSIGSGAIASGAIASGAVASGAYAAGSIADGAMVTIGAKTDAASTATDTTSTSVVSVLKEISAKVQAPASTPVTGTFYQSTQPVSIASGQIASGAVVSGAYASGSIASGAVASGAIAAGAIVSGAAVAGAFADGAISTLGLKTDAASTATDTTSTSVVSILKEISTLEQAPVSRAVTNANLDAPLSGLATASAQSTGNASLATIASAVHLEDAAAVNGEAGVKILGRRNDANTVLTDADGDEGGIVVDPHGHLITRIWGSDGSGTDGPAAISRGGAVVVQPAFGPPLPKLPCNAVRRTNCAAKGF